MATYRTTDGKRVTQGQINSRYSNTLREMEACYFCEAEGPNCNGKPLTNSHILSRADCKGEGAADLIYDANNIQQECQVCHLEWEAIHGDNWKRHKNLEYKLNYLKRVSPTYHQKRINELKP